MCRAVADAAEALDRDRSHVGAWRLVDHSTGLGDFANAHLWPAGATQLLLEFVASFAGGEDVPDPLDVAGDGVEARDDELLECRFHGQFAGMLG